MSRIINFCSDYLSMSDSAEIGNKGERTESIKWKEKSDRERKTILQNKDFIAKAQFISPMSAVFL